MSCETLVLPGYVCGQFILKPMVTWDSTIDPVTAALGSPVAVNCTAPASSGSVVRFVALPAVVVEKTRDDCSVMMMGANKSSETPKDSVSAKIVCAVMLKTIADNIDRDNRIAFVNVSLAFPVQMPKCCELFTSQAGNHTTD